MQREYQQALSQPGVTTGADVENAVDASLAAQGITTTTGGTTDQSGNITIAPRPPNPCNDVLNAATWDHERVHQQTQQSLEALHGAGTSAFNNAWNDATNWVNDDVNAYRAEIDFWTNFKSSCSACGA